MKSVVLRVAAALIGVTCVAATAAPAATAVPPPRDHTSARLPARFQAEGDCPGTEMWRRKPWWVKRTDPENLWEKAGTRGEGVIVAVIDSGVQRTQQLTNVIKGKSFLDGSDGTTAANPHGTAVAGIIGAQPLEGTGVVGIAPGVKILPILQNDGQRGNDVNMAQAIRYAVDHGAKIINLSQAAFAHSNDDPEPDSLYNAVTYALEKDVLIVAAAGNDGEDRNRVPWPAADKRVLTVGASDSNNSPAGFSGYGEWMDVLAPGVAMITTVPAGGHCQFDGTSFAAPYVAGVAALIRAKYKNLRAQEVAYRIMATAEPVGPGWSQYTGWGVVDPLRAVTTPQERLPKLTREVNLKPELAPAWPIARLSAEEKRERIDVSAVIVIGLGLVAAFSFAAVVAKDAATRRRRTTAP